MDRIIIIKLPILNKHRIETRPSHGEPIFPSRFIFWPWPRIVSCGRYKDRVWVSVNVRAILNCWAIVAKAIIIPFVHTKCTLSFPAHCLLLFPTLNLLICCIQFENTLDWIQQIQILQRIPMLLAYSPMKKTGHNWYNHTMWSKW